MKPQSPVSIFWQVPCIGKISVPAGGLSVFGLIIDQVEKELPGVHKNIASKYANCVAARLGAARR